jgi:hypothetical protein
MSRTNTAQVEQVEEDTTVAVVVPTLEELATEHKVERFAKQAEEQVVNPIVLANLVGCRPQMVYNYIRKGTIKGVKDNNTQKIVIPLDEAQRWANEYLTRKGEKQLRIEAELQATEAS